MTTQISGATDITVIAPTLDLSHKGIFDVQFSTTVLWSYTDFFRLIKTATQVFVTPGPKARPSASWQCRLINIKCEEYVEVELFLSNVNSVDCMHPRSLFCISFLGLGGWCHCFCLSPLYIKNCIHHVETRNGVNTLPCASSWTWWRCKCKTSPGTVKLDMIFLVNLSSHQTSGSTFFVCVCLFQPQHVTFTFYLTHINSGLPNILYYSFYSKFLLGLHRTFFIARKGHTFSSCVLLSQGLISDHCLIKRERCETDALRTFKSIRQMCFMFIDVCVTDAAMPLSFQTVDGKHGEDVRWFLTLLTGITSAT